MKPLPKLSIETLLYHYGAETVPVGDRWRKMRCILPGHDDRHPSASVHIEAGKFNCFSCDFTGDGYDLIQRIEGCDFRAALDIAERLPDSRREQVPEIDLGRDSWLPRRKGHIPGGSAYVPPWLRKGA